MAISSTSVAHQMGALRQACIERGVKVTHQRLAIYRELALSDEHPDADMIYRRVRKRIPTISRDTVYRNLKMLSEQGLISIVGMSHERLRFDANMEAHHHFVCTACSLIRDFCSEHLENMAFPKEAKAFGKPVSLHLEVKGVCTICDSRAETKD